MDVYQPADTSGPVPALLLWHGRGPDERDVLAPVARAAAALGVIVLVPDWRRDALDGGRTHLGESALFARQSVSDFGGDPEQIALAGWSLGGKAAVGDTALKERGWQVSLDEVATDHAGVITTEFVPEHDRCLPSTADPAVETGARTAGVLAQASGITAYDRHV
ncbi:hypothetical protein [Streptomyces sp. NPDC046759]|uniref:hypothetical protein n=1 Tax=Streptomyces sp. NPDC046759 TaxID=3155019 RepID=UPI0033E8F52C